MFTRQVLQELFTHHPLKPGQLERYQAIRIAALDFATVLVANTPQSSDQSAAIRELRVCVMTANAAIALEK